MTPVAVLCARMNSKRLPYKAMLDLKGKPVIEHIIDRIRAAGLPLICATTQCRADMAIIKRCKSLNVTTFMGDENNVLHRVFKASQIMRADPVVRITGDCAMIDPAIIKNTVECYFDEKADYCASRLDPCAYPDGMDVEVISFDAIKQAYEYAETEYEKEHVTPWIKEIGLFKCVGLPSDKVYPETLRLSIDTPKDYESAQEIFSKLDETNPLFGLDEIMEVL